MATADKDDKIMNVEQIAKFFGVSDQTIWRWCKAGKIPAFKIGAQWKIRRSDLNRIISQKLTSRKIEGKNLPLF
jgi:excisionase family DNA binding protein